MIEKCKKVLFCVLMAGILFLIAYLSLFDKDAQLYSSGRNKTKAIYSNIPIV